MAEVRQAAVAGFFYPGEAGELDRAVQALLAKAPAEGGLPKAVIAPHAGYVYSGPVAAAAYARIRQGRGRIERVVLIGPSHRVPFRGLAVPSAEAFATPLGEMRVDTRAVDEILALPQVARLDEAHAGEHSLEVQLPFLQEVLGDVPIVPIAAGQASAEEVAEVLETLWGGPETLIVASSDLSHYHDYDTARRIDAATTQAIEGLRPQDIDFEQACGRVPIIGLLTVAKRRGLACTTIDLRNSGDTAGPKDRVVGYGAYVFTPPGGGGPGLRDRHGRTMLAVAEASIDHGLSRGRALDIARREFAAALQENGACFVTLKTDGGRLRGCIGSPEASRPLIEDVAVNAYRAAFKDPRFPPLTRRERPGLEVSLSVLTPPVEMAFASEAEFLAQLRPGRDGVILEAGRNRGLFLPAVWETLPEPVEFVAHLKLKAGLEPGHWSSDTRAWRFEAVSISAADLPDLP